MMSYEEDDDSRRRWTGPEGLRLFLVGTFTPFMLIYFYRTVMGLVGVVGAVIVLASLCGLVCLLAGTAYQRPESPKSPLREVAWQIGLPGLRPAKPE